MIPGILGQMEEPEILVEMVIAFKYIGDFIDQTWHHTIYQNYCPRLWTVVTMAIITRMRLLLDWNCDSVCDSIWETEPWIEI